MIHIDVHENCPVFKTPATLSTCAQNSSTPFTLNVQFQTNSSHDNQSIKRKHNPRMTIICYQQSSLTLKYGFTVWCQSQIEDFLSMKLMSGYINVWVSMMSGHGTNLFFLIIIKKKIGCPEHSLNPHLPKSNNILFLHYPHPPNSGRHMCITP